jgi:hypothetical protein
VRFEVTKPPLTAGYCHCTRCQRRTGTAASAQVRIAPGSLQLQSGADLVRVFQPPDGFGKAFCSSCGTALWSVDPATGEPGSVRFSAFDDDPGLRPSFRTFTANACAWEPIPDDGLTRYPEGLART